MTRRVIHLMVILTIFIGYYVLTDPQLGLISDLPFGADLVLAINFIVLATIGGITAELSFRLWSNKESEPSPIEDEALNSHQAGYVYIGNSVRLLAFALIISSSIMAIFK